MEEDITTRCPAGSPEGACILWEERQNPVKGVSMMKGEAKTPLGASGLHSKSDEARR